MNGYIYLLKNPHISFVKVGFTTKTPEERALDISSATGVPGQWKVVHYWKVEHAHKAEQRLFKGPLRLFRLDSKQEFFKLDIAEAILKISDFLENAGIDPFEHKEKELAEKQRKYEEEKIERKRLALEQVRKQIETDFIKPLLVNDVKNAQKNELETKLKIEVELKTLELDLSNKSLFVLVLFFVIGFVLTLFFWRMGLGNWIVSATVLVASWFVIDKSYFNSKRGAISDLRVEIEKSIGRLKKVETDFLDCYLFLGKSETNVFQDVGANKNFRELCGYPKISSLKQYYEILTLIETEKSALPQLTINEYFRCSFNAARGYWLKLPPLNLSQILAIKSEHDRYDKLLMQFNDLLEKEYQRSLKIEGNEEKRVLKAIKYSGHKPYYGRRRRY